MSDTNMNAGAADGLSAPHYAHVSRHAIRSDYFGVRWYRPPEVESSSIQSEPSGASSISRTRLSTLHRCAAVAPPFPSNVTRIIDRLPRPLIKASPFHCGKTLPLEHDIARRDH